MEKKGCNNLHPQSMCPAFGGLRVLMRIDGVQVCLVADQGCAYGLTFVSHFYAARKSIVTPELMNVQISGGTMIDDVRKTIEEIALDPAVKFIPVVSTCVAETAGILGGKKTSSLIPLCHPLQVSDISVRTAIDRTGVKVTAEAVYTGKTGVEMEALTAVSAAALTIYDMCKAADRSMILSDIKLIRKSGGRSGTFIRKDDDRAVRGKKEGPTRSGRDRKGERG